MYYIKKLCNHLYSLLSLILMLKSTIYLRVLTRVTNKEIKFLSKGDGTYRSKIPFVSNLKESTCASKRDRLELAILWYVEIFAVIKQSPWQSHCILVLVSQMSGVSLLGTIQQLLDKRNGRGWGVNKSSYLSTRGEGVPFLQLLWQHLTEMLFGLVNVVQEK